MQNIKTVTIKLNSLKSNNLPSEYVEIYKPNENMRFLLGSWLRIKDKDTLVNSSGGFLINIEGNLVTLRNKTNMEIDIKKHFFYIKKDNQQYIALKELLLEKQKFSHEKEIFEKEKKDFESVSQKFYKLFLEGKVKISD